MAVLQYVWRKVNGRATGYLHREHRTRTRAHPSIRRLRGARHPTYPACCKSRLSLLDYECIAYGLIARQTRAFGAQTVGPPQRQEKKSASKLRRWKFRFDTSAVTRYAAKIGLGSPSSRSGVGRRRGLVERERTYPWERCLIVSSCQRAAVFCAERS